jgi:hypothetical protein
MPTEGIDVVDCPEDLNVPMEIEAPSPTPNPDDSDSSSITAVDSNDHTASASDEGKNINRVSVDSDIKLNTSNSLESSDTQRLIQSTGIPATFRGLSISSNVEGIVESEIQDEDSTISQRTEPEHGSETTVGKDIHLVDDVSQGE